jgi:hypothetical protein
MTPAQKVERAAASRPRAGLRWEEKMSSDLPISPSMSAKPSFTLMAMAK